MGLAVLEKCLLTSPRHLAASPSRRSGACAGWGFPKAALGRAGRQASPTGRRRCWQAGWGPGPTLTSPAPAGLWALLAMEARGCGKPWVPPS